MRRALFVLLILLSLFIGLTWGQKSKTPPQLQNPEEASFSINVAEYKSKVARMDAKLIGLRNQFMLNLESRGFLAARKRYTEAIEFYYHGGDYLGAAERLLGLIEEPDVRKLEDFPAVRFYLADSLFKIGAHNLASKYLDEILLNEVDPFWAQAMVERFQVASALGEVDRMRGLYTAYLSKFPTDQDGSAIDYYMGKANYLSGDRAGAARCFEHISDKQGYAAMARYFLGVMATEEGRYAEAISRFNQSVEATKSTDSVNRKDVYDLANMAIARLYYEQDQYSNALEHYFLIPGESPLYPRVLYEVLWIYYTRNGMITGELRQLELSYQQLAWQLESSVADLDAPGLESVRQSLAPTIEEATKVQSDIEKLIVELHSGMNKLREEGVSAQDNLVKLAPDSPYVPQATLLSTRVLSQLGDYDRAESQFGKIEDDYSKLKRNLEVALTSGTQIPSQFNTWLKYEDDMQGFQDVKKSAGEIQPLFDDTKKIESEIQAEISTFAYETSPIMGDAMKRSSAIRQQLEVLTEEGAALAVEIENFSRSSDYKRLKNSIVDDRESVDRLKQELIDLDSQIQQKAQEEQQNLAKILADVSSPLADLSTQFAMVSTEIEQKYAEAQRAKLQSYVSILEKVAFEAALGQIDVTWQRAQAVNQEIQRIMRAQEEEIRKYQLSLKGEQ